MDSTAQTSSPKFICAAFIDIFVVVEEERGEGGGCTHYSDWINQDPPPQGIWLLEGQILLNSSVGKVIIFAGGLRLDARVRTIHHRVVFFFFFCRLENKKVSDMRSHRDTVVFLWGL